MLVTQQSGTLRVFEGGTLRAALVLPVCASSERGLLGVAVDPEFPDNRYVYLYYTRPIGEWSSSWTATTEPIGERSSSSETATTDGIGEWSSSSETATTERIGEWSSSSETATTERIGEWSSSSETATTECLNRVSRFVLPDTGSVDPASETVLLDRIP